ncbi:MAG: hypothetical protein AAFY14_00560 [Pseudomonadota bacterium]
MSKLHNVARLAAILRGVTIAAMVVLPITIAGGLLVTPLVPDMLDIDMPVSPDATRGQLLGAIVIGLANPLILLWTLNKMRRLFAAYTRGEILTDDCALLIQKIGQGFVALAIATFVLRPIQMVLLTMANPPGERSLTIGLNSEMLFFALSGGLIIIIGWAMREASAAAAENRSFV